MKIKAAGVSKCKCTDHLTSLALLEALHPPARVCASKSHVLAALNSAHGSKGLNVSAKRLAPRPLALCQPSLQASHTKLPIPAAPPSLHNIILDFTTHAVALMFSYAQKKAWAPSTMDVCEEVMCNRFKTSECKMMTERNSIIACVTSPWVESVSD